MFFAVRRRLGARKVEVRSLGAGVMCATPIANIHHTVHRMLLAICRHLALKIEGRFFGA